jgi:hypothetical protein
MNGNLKSLASLEVEGVVERLRVQEHTQAVGFPHFRAFGHVPIVSAKDLVPVGDVVQLTVERQLWLDDAADAVVRPEVGIEVSHIAKSMFHAITCLRRGAQKFLNYLDRIFATPLHCYLKDHNTIGLLHGQPGELKALFDVLAESIEVGRPIAELAIVEATSPCDSMVTKLVLDKCF